MDREELFREVSMAYDDLCKYLISKYGASKLDYFPNPQCRSKRPKISRSSEGLYCHHIDEDKGDNLSGLVTARRQPFAWQKADRLVYCNALEHLLLHLKIAVMRQKKRYIAPIEIHGFFSTQGFIVICHSINSLYEKGGNSSPSFRECYSAIKNNFDEYILLLKATLLYLDKQYVGVRRPRTNINWEDTYPSVTDSVEEALAHIDLSLQLSYHDNMDMLKASLSSTMDGNGLLKVYRLLVEEDTSSDTNRLCEIIENDFRGYGFPQYADFYMANIPDTQGHSFNAITADQYISKAFPSASSSNCENVPATPRFWIGKIPEKVLTGDSFFIVRFLASFRIKENQQAFVYNRLAFSHAPDEDNNFLYHRGELVEATDTPIEVTLTKDDLYLFFERYDIFKFEVLDGCCL